MLSVNSKIFCGVVLLFSQVGFAGISSSSAPIKTESISGSTREPASAVGSAIIKNKDNFRVEAFGESRAKEHLKERRASPSENKDFIQEVEGI